MVMAAPFYPTTFLWRNLDTKLTILNEESLQGEAGTKVVCDIHDSR